MAVNCLVGVGFGGGEQIQKGKNEKNSTACKKNTPITEQKARRLGCCRGTTEWKDIGKIRSVDRKKESGKRQRNRCRKRGERASARVRQQACSRVERGSDPNLKRNGAVREKKGEEPGFRWKTGTIPDGGQKDRH